MLLLVSVFLLTVGGYGQSTASLPAFEVADIKPSSPDAIRSKGRILPGGRIEMPGGTLKELVMFAYGVQDNMIQGAPKWADHDRFDIVAKAANNSSVQTLRLMMQQLLADRFKLAIHQEDKMMAAFVLTVDKNGPKLENGDGGKQQCNWSVIENGLRRRECQNMSMQELARQLPGWGGIGIDRQVVDETGLKGAYNFYFDVGIVMDAGMINAAKVNTAEREGRAPGMAIRESGPTIFAALQKLGLKLESRKTATPIIIIDHVEPPSDN
jgi:uncharacterized protein (TIGR03435 family)